MIRSRMSKTEGGSSVDKISISTPDGSQSITMPRTRDLRLSPKEECKEITMASGKTVKEMVGIRQVITATWDWVPADTITALCAMLAQGGYFRVAYPATDGDQAGMFAIPPPSPRVFRYRDGVARWRDISLTMTAQEVM